MNRRMMPALFTLLALVALAGLTPGCVAKRQAASLAANPWVVKQLYASGTHQAVLPGTTPVIVFRSDGTAVGNYTVNSFRGPAKIQARSINIGPLVSTKWPGSQMELQQEKQIHDLLPAVSRYVVSGGNLQLSDGSGTMLLLLAVGQEPRLVGPVWACTSYAGPSGQVSVIGTAPLSASFAPDGGLNGWTGVSTYSATCTVAASGLTIGPITTTKGSGPEALMKQEGSYLAAIAKTASFKIESYQLTLYDEAGSVLAVYAPIAPKS